MPIPSGAVRPAHRSARDLVYGQLREWILDGTFEPGEVIRDVEVAGPLGVSRTPVREALLQLGYEGLVEFRRGRATLVAHPRYERAPDLFAVGGALDALAAGAAATRVTAAELDEMRALVRRMASETDPAVVRTLDERFHAVYYVAAANAVVLEQMEQINHELRRIERRALADESIKAEAHHEHQAILAALERGDADAAREAAQANWTNSWERIAARQAEPGAGPAPVGAP